MHAEGRCSARNREHPATRTSIARGQVAVLGMYGGMHACLHACLRASPLADAMDGDQCLRFVRPEPSTRGGRTCMSACSHACTADTSRSALRAEVWPSSSARRHAAARRSADVLLSPCCHQAGDSAPVSPVEYGVPQDEVRNEELCLSGSWGRTQVWNLWTVRFRLHPSARPRGGSCQQSCAARGRPAAGGDGRCGAVLDEPPGESGPGREPPERDGAPQIRRHAFMHA